MQRAQETSATIRNRLQDADPNTTLKAEYIKFAKQVQAQKQGRTLPPAEQSLLQPQEFQDLQKINQIAHYEHADNPDQHEQTKQHAEVKLAKYLSNTIRTETTRTFLSAMAEKL